MALVVLGVREWRAAAMARRNLADAARQLGLLHIDVGTDQDAATASHAAVSRLLSDMLSGARREVTPLGMMSYVLRRQHAAEVVEPGLDEVVARVARIRGGGSAPEGS